MSVKYRVSIIAIKGKYSGTIQTITEKKPFCYFDRGKTICLIIDRNRSLNEQ